MCAREFPDLQAEAVVRSNRGCDAENQNGVVRWCHEPDFRRRRWGQEPPKQYPKTIEEFAPGAFNARTAGLENPKLLKQVPLKYTPNALRARVEGKVVIFAIVGVDGRVGRSEVSEPLHPDLDAEALRTLAQWQFEPGRLNGTPVSVAVTVQMEFRTHKD